MVFSRGWDCGVFLPVSRQVSRKTASAARVLSPVRRPCWNRVPPIMPSTTMRTPNTARPAKDFLGRSDFGAGGLRMRAAVAVMSWMIPPGLTNSLPRSTKTSGVAAMPSVP